MNFRGCRDILMVANKALEGDVIEADLHLLYVISDSYEIYKNAIVSASGVYPLHFYAEFDDLDDRINRMNVLYQDISKRAANDEKPEINDKVVNEFMECLMHIHNAFITNGYSITNSGDYYSVESANSRMFSVEEALEYREAIAGIED